MSDAVFNLIISKKDKDCILGVESEERSTRN